MAATLIAPGVDLRGKLRECRSRTISRSYAYHSEWLFVFVASDITLALGGPGRRRALRCPRRLGGPTMASGAGRTTTTGATGSTRCATSCSWRRWWPVCTWPATRPCSGWRSCSTREALQLVAVTALRLVPTLHRLSRDFNFRANAIGKLTTVVQFAGGDRAPAQASPGWPGGLGRGRPAGCSASSST